MKILFKAYERILKYFLPFVFIFSCEKPKEKYEIIIENYMMENIDDPSSYQFVSISEPRIVKLYSNKVDKAIFDTAYYLSMRKENAKVEDNIKRLYEKLKVFSETKDRMKKYAYNGFKSKLLSDGEVQAKLGNFLIEKGIYEDQFSFYESIHENQRFKYVYKKDSVVFKKIFIKFRYRKDNKLLLYKKEFRLDLKDSIIYAGAKVKIGNI